MAIKRKLTFVVGAGASYELGLPVGRGLLDDISKLIRKNSIPGVVYASDRHMSFDFVSDDLDDHVKRLIAKETGSFTISAINTWKKEAYWIAENCSLAPSIDNLLHTHQDDRQIVDLGKLMICAALKNAEAHSCLMKTPNDHSSNGFLYTEKNWGGKKVSGPTSWLGQMFWLLAEGNSFHDFLLALAQVNFISFNYDRCIQHYLIHAAKSYFRLKTSDEILKVASAIQIVFPYGSLGGLEISEGGAKGFGEFDLTEAAKKIRTFTEGMEDPAHRKTIDQMITEATELVFLGFGFNDQNLKLIFSSTFSHDLKRISGTALGFSTGNNLSVVSKLLEKVPNPKPFQMYSFGNSNVLLENLTCHDFFVANNIRLRS